jgi:hypothetical protein
VIRIDPVRLDVLELGQAAEIGQRRGIVKQKLVRYDVGRFLPRDSEVSIGLEVAFVFRGEFYSLIDALGVVECVEHQGLAEISVVEQVGCDLVISVDPEVDRGAIGRSC